jgi:hypothetical protein
MSNRRPATTPNSETSKGIHHRGSEHSKVGMDLNLAHAEDAAKRNGEKASLVTRRFRSVMPRTPNSFSRNWWWNLLSSNELACIAHKFLRISILERE